MASIDKHPPRPGDPKQRVRWRARWRDPDGRQRSKVFARKVDAERHLIAMEHAKHSGAYVDPSDGKVTLRDWCERWRVLQVQHRPSTAAQVESYFRLHVYPALGSRPLATLRPSDVQAWVTERADHLAPGSVELAYRHLAAALKAAEHDRVIGRTPCQRIKLPARPKADIRPPSVEQVAAIADAMTDRYRATVILAAGAGLRLGEVFGLGPEHVDRDGCAVRVERQLFTPSDGPAVLGPPKTSSSVRTVPLADVVVQELARHVERFPPAGGLVFTTELDTPVRRGTFQDAWRRATRTAGAEGVRFHDLRHHYASALISAGCSVVSVQKALGHASATETLNTYAHLWPEDEDRTRAAIDAAWSVERPSSSARDSALH